MSVKTKGFEIKAEQADAIGHENGNLLVSASAGSGKTFVMIERLVRLIKEKKTSVDRVLAVTFTEASASDMKEKLKKKLAEAVQEGDQSLAPVIYETATADISTLHSFCGRLVRKYFFVAGVAPDFKVADEKLADIVRSESMNLTFRQLYASKDNQWFLSLVDKFAYKRSDSRLKEIVQSLYFYLWGEADPLAFASRALDNYSPTSYQKIKDAYLEYFRAHVEKCIANATSVLLDLEAIGHEKAIEKAQAIVNELNYAKSLSLDKLYTVPTITTNLNLGKNAPEELKPYTETLSRVKGEYKKFCELFNKFITDPANEEQMLQTLYKDTQNLITLVESFAKTYATEKAEENLLDFSDLEHFALKVLSDPTVREEISNKYDYIFFDEYQDVNGVQEAIINLIAKNNVFMVGDFKQSIYGFRGSRADFFLTKREKMPKEGQTVLPLSYNFRSAKLVIDAVNAIFGYCMTERSAGVNYQKEKLIKGGVFPSHAQGRAVLHTFEKPKREEKEARAPQVYDLLKETVFENQEDQTVSVSNLVYKIIQDEIGNKYYKGDKEKRITYGDICILARKKDNGYVQKIVEGLIRHGVPVASEVSENVCDYPEVKVLIRVLELLECFSSDVPLATTLKSPVGKLTEEDLAEIALFYDRSGVKVRGEGFYEAYCYYLQNAKGELQTKLKEFDDKFKVWRTVSDFCGAHDVLEKIVDDCDYIPTLYASRLGEMKVKRVLRFISESANDSKTLTVLEFLRKIENCKEAFEFFALAETDTVKVMTMHSSKGLEFPVVIVVGMEQSIHNREEEKAYHSNQKYSFAISYFDQEQRVRKETVLRGLIRRMELEEQEREEMRLLYVATTRATYSLHLTHVGKLPDQKPKFDGATKYIDYIPLDHPDLPVVKYLPEDLEWTTVAGQTAGTLYGEPNEQTVAKMRADFSRKYEYESDCSLPLKSSVTASLSSQEQTALEYYLFDDESTTDTERGNIAHKIMEHALFDGSKTLDKQVEELVEKSVLTSEQVSLIKLDGLKKAFDLDVFNGFEKKTLYREKSFIANVSARAIGEFDTDEKVLVQGVIDLLAVDENSAQIVDYKYSALTPESLRAKYTKQLELYKIAVETSLGIKVDKLTLVNLLTGDVVNVL